MSSRTSSSLASSSDGASSEDDDDDVPEGCGGKRPQHTPGAARSTVVGPAAAA
eukprot:CAMPEP_0185708460 /NCGR_PEP_ID=MMETSP1164-20130828/26614_1 /TAXON_ID=1104430 /ORGANISM="Chrysoreinhardia sp, Strain CCMP2950" /LENGTH=52 /DNA_ID=CAMNT_0028375919 /DNA_START=8 /DNA_END=162 /DNA_ORIENTATION=+